MKVALLESIWIRKALSERDEVQYNVGNQVREIRLVHDFSNIKDDFLYKKSIQWF